MKIYLDIGSTCIKGHITDEDISFYIDRDYSINPGSQVKSILEQKISTINDEVFISSSANGGLRVVLIGLTESLSSKICYSLISSSGGNVVQCFSGNNPELSELLEDHKVDIYVVARGTSGQMSFESKKSLLDLMSRLMDKGVDMSKVICATSIEVFPQKFNEIRCIPAILTDRLDISGEKLSSALKDIYIDDLIDSKGLRDIADIVNTHIHPTPQIVHKGFENVVIGSTKDQLGTKNILCLDIGGATTDIYFPKLSANSQDGINILTAPTERWVLVSIGFEHSIENTIKVAKGSYWYSEFMKLYRSNAFDMEEYSRSLMVMLSALIAILNACSDGGLGLNYRLNFNSIESILLTGGGPFALEGKDKYTLEQFVQGRLGNHIKIDYDKEYNMWKQGHDA